MFFFRFLLWSAMDLVIQQLVFTTITATLITLVFTLRRTLIVNKPVCKRTTLLALWVSFCINRKIISSTSVQCRKTRKREDYCSVLQTSDGIRELFWPDYLYRNRSTLSVVFDVCRTCRWLAVPLPKRYCHRFTWWFIFRIRLWSVFTAFCVIVAYLLSKSYVIF